jgi:hypothetical protein
MDSSRRWSGRTHQAAFCAVVARIAGRRVGMTRLSCIADVMILRRDINIHPSLDIL